jgi:hypothetical protein
MEVSALSRRNLKSNSKPVTSIRTASWTALTLFILFEGCKRFEGRDVATKS